MAKDWSGIIKRVLANSVGLIGISMLLFSFLLSAVFDLSSSVVSGAMASEPFAMSAVLGLGIVFILLVVIALAAFAAPEPVITNILGMITAGFAFVIGVGIIVLALIFSYVIACALVILAALAYCVSFVGARRLSPAIALPMGACGLAAGLWFADGLDFGKIVAFGNPLSSMLAWSFLALGICALAVTGYNFIDAYAPKEYKKCSKCGAKCTSRFCPECGEKLR